MVFVFVTQVATGETRSFVGDWTCWRGLESDFMWSEGNYACDCNRALFFARAIGEPDPNVQCTSSKYRVRIVVDEQTVFEG